MELRLYGVVKESIVDGPGIRYTIFTQGCPHNCLGCHNHLTHNFDGGFFCDISKVVNDISKNPLLRGVTFSGGEPFCQAEALYELAKKIKELGLNIVVFSGYTFEQLLENKDNNPCWEELLSVCDILIDGKFELSERDLTLTYRGSKNQRIIDLNKSLRNNKAMQIQEFLEACCE